MKYRVDNDKIFVQLDRGDWIHKSIAEVIEKESLSSGWIKGIGAVEGMELGYFDYPTRTYKNKIFSGEYELINYDGNITISDGKPFIHAHAIFGDENYQVVGGHLYDAQISAVGEFVILPGEIKINRKLDNNLKLTKWELSWEK